jgi:hypothetical protein
MSRERRDDGDSVGSGHHARGPLRPLRGWEAPAPAWRGGGAASHGSTADTTAPAPATTHPSIQPALSRPLRQAVSQCMLPVPSAFGGTERVVPAILTTGSSADQGATRRQKSRRSRGPRWHSRAAQQPTSHQPLQLSAVSSGARQRRQRRRRPAGTRPVPQYSRTPTQVGVGPQIRLALAAPRKQPRHHQDKAMRRPVACGMRGSRGQQ